MDAGSSKQVDLLLEKTTNKIALGGSLKVRCAQILRGFQLRHCMLRNRTI